MKIKKPRSGGVLLPETKWTYTFYTRDAQGNVMSTYERPENSADLFVNDFQIYGSSRVGTYTVGESLASLATTNQYSLKTGKKNYELTNHLGNVMVTFTDVRKPKDTNADGVIDSYEATVVSANDYYPFGMLQPGRNVSPSDYRYGFNGKEKDDDIAGTTGAVYDYGFRIYDSRIGKFLSVDPLTKEYPWNSTYAYAENDVIRSIDLDGLEKHIIITIGTDIKYRGQNLVKKLNSLDIIHYNILSTEPAPQKIVEKLKSVSQNDDIASVTIFSHGSGASIFANAKEKDAIKNKFSYKEIDLLKSKDIKLLNALIYLGGCNSGTDLFKTVDYHGNLIKSESFGQKVANATGSSVIAAEDQVGPKDENDFTYQTSHPKTKQFFEFNSNASKQEMGGEVNLVNEIFNAQKRYDSHTLKPLKPIEIKQITSKK